MSRLGQWRQAAFPTLLPTSLPHPLPYPICSGPFPSNLCALCTTQHLRLLFSKLPLPIGMPPPMAELWALPPSCFQTTGTSGQFPHPVWWQPVHYPTVALLFTVVPCTFLHACHHSFSLPTTTSCHHSLLLLGLAWASPALFPTPVCLGFWLHALLDHTDTCTPAAACLFWGWLSCSTSLPSTYIPFYILPWDSSG